jgi:hypothetical protein
MMRATNPRGLEAEATTTGSRVEPLEVVQEPDPLEWDRFVADAIGSSIFQSAAWGEGLALFKRGFGGRLVHLVGDLDRAIDPLGYRLWRCREPFSLRKKGVRA